ncbi:MAG: CYTH domain-containing protein [Proteobacteria bacterium]|nr:CYTH domain-containing protein [Pseudomonadota bacterium]
MNNEIEAKYLSVNLEGCRADLRNAEFSCVRPWSLMRRYTFMLTELNPSLHKWARVRDEGDKITMTFKQVHDAQRINGTEEVEFEVSDFDSAVLFMQRIGFIHWAYQENQRETWVKDGIEVTLNEWPALPPFVEIEAANETLVKDASKELGFDYGKAVFGGIGRLYGLQTAFTEEDISNVRELTFSKAKTLQVEVGT